MKFYRIVSQTQERPNFNKCYIVVQIIGLSVWVISWVLAGIFLLVHHIDFDDFKLDRNLLITHALSFFATMFSYIIMALVIYKSAIFAGKDETEAGQLHGITLVSGLRDQFYLERQLRMESEDSSGLGAVTSHHTPSTPSLQTLNIK